MRTRRIVLTLTAAVAAFALGLCLIACNGGTKDPEPAPSPDPTPTPVPNQDPTPAPEPVKSVTVSPDYSYSGTFKDSFGTTYTFSYKLPKIDGPDTDYIAKIQSTINALRTEKIDPGVQSMEIGREPGWNKVEYEAQAAGNIITLLFTWSNPYDNLPEYRLFVIKADGTMGENSELFAAKGVTADKVLAKVRELLAEKVGGNDYAAIEATLGKEFADEARAAEEKTLSDSNINTHMPFYINSEGHLAVVATAYTAAGAGIKLYFFDLGF